MLAKWATLEEAVDEICSTLAKKDTDEVSQSISQSISQSLHMVRERVQKVACALKAIENIDSRWLTNDK